MERPAVSFEHPQNWQNGPRVDSQLQNDHKQNLLPMWQIAGRNEPLPDDESIPSSQVLVPRQFGNSFENFDSPAFQLEPSISQPLFSITESPREREDAFVDELLEREIPRPLRPNRPPAQRQFVPTTNSVADNAGNDRRAIRFQWEGWMIEALLELRKMEWEEYESQTTREHMISTEVRWGRIVESLKEKNCGVDVSQCRGKWEAVVGGYRKIKDHNNRSRNAPFSSLAKTECKDLRLPLEFSDK
ncbi:hypothetical protein R1flu_015839 [Riccia fluitans]|uniref:Myb/SANT-like DNA-binding domain-containing protein n=1 Tax=Riccia fluitans TaxID=41844 RepID=A0ABD1YKA7_9MARC